jgi:hypothetical protein
MRLIRLADKAEPKPVIKPAAAARRLSLEAVLLSASSRSPFIPG